VGLKTDIYVALEKNIGKEHIKNSPEGKAKIDTLAEDLANAILDFLTDKDRCVLKVDKLTMNYTSQGSPVTVPMIPGPAASAQIIPHLPFGVDKDGQSPSNPMGGGANDSNTSEVRLRKDNVKGESGKY
jgi:hypothetical protein